MAFRSADAVYKRQDKDKSAGKRAADYEVSAISACGMSFT